MDKLTHKSHTDPNTTGTGSGLGTSGTHSHTTGTGSGLGTSSATGTGAGYHNVSGTTGTGAGYDQTSAGGLGQTTISTGAGQYGTTGVTGGATTSRGEIIDSETFTKTEDHEVLIEKKRYELEHRPVQKQYVVETKFVGEQQVVGGPTEVVGNETHEVDERIKQAPAGDQTVVVENVDVPAGELRSNTTDVTGTSAAGTGSTY